uniref:Major facilitator superfamily (MFS) profile domain-containing protein n=1 Tax=Hyaloperonospora arabidopsidis (strain Emoy2) TaxID=559515 RepID=M4BFX9_HYAAE
MIKYNISNLAQMLGPMLSIFLFWIYGDKWQLPELKTVLELGGVLAAVASFILFRFDDDRARDYMQTETQEETDRQMKLTPPSPIRTPKLVGNEMDLVYDYPDEDDIVIENHSTPTVSENTALLLFKGKSAEEMEEERQQRLQPVMDDDDEGYMGNSDSRFLCFRTKHVPYILFASDFIICNGAGMTINFFPLFFKEEYGLTPVHVCALFMTQPLIVMILSFISQRLSKSCGRMPIIAFTRTFSVACLFAMAYAQPVALQIALFLMRGGMMRCSQPLRRSILMDYVQKNIRARWNALEGLSVFSFSGSAVLGGYLIDAYGYRICFIITSFVYCVGLSLEMFLLPLTKHAIER